MMGADCLCYFDTKAQMEIPLPLSTPLGTVPLLKEKEALSEELNICVDKVIKIRLYHHHMVCTVMNISVMPVAYGPTVLA